MGAPGDVIRALRLKFVVASMTAITLVVVATFATICYLDYRQSVEHVYEQLQLAVDAAMKPERGPWRFGGDHDFGDGLAMRGLEEEDAEDSFGWPALEDALGEGDVDAESGQEPASPDAEAEDEEGEHPLPPQIGGMHREGVTIPVAVYLAYDDGQVAVALSGSTASISADVLGEALTDLKDGGRLDALDDAAAGASAAVDRACGQLAGLGLFYCAHPVSGGTIVAFADASNASSWEALALTLTGVGLLVLMVFLVASIFFARWALRPVQQAWSQQQQFIADASHELKTPLTVMLANLSILKSRPQETVADQAQWVESTEVEAERMQGLVNDMLELARPKQAPALGAAETRVDFSDLAEGEVLQFEAVAFERGISLESEAEEGLQVTGDEARLKRLAAILLDNACKYAEPQGEDAPFINVSLVREGSFAVLSVRNSGPAIPPEDLPRLFDRFYRVDKSRTKAPAGGSADVPSKGGFGLGLAIAQDIVRAHNGTIAVTSTNPKGTTFTVKLPLA